MSYVLTIFRAQLIQDSALSVSGIDAASTSDQPFTFVDNCPVLSGRGIKGAAVAMARRCFAELPPSITGEPPGAAPTEDNREREPNVRSAWEFDHARPTAFTSTGLRAGVGISQSTGARAEGVLYDREVMPAGTSWDLTMRVDWRLAARASDDPAEVEEILGYVLTEQWAKERCWLGGGVARGLGWCHLDLASLEVYRLDDAAHQRWIQSGRPQLPPKETTAPARKPTRSWCFRYRDISLRFGEHRPDPAGPAWGIDMLAIGPHSQNSSTQPLGSGRWAAPRLPSSQAEIAALSASQPSPAVELVTNRSLAMEGDTPLLPGSSLRGPLRHASARRRRKRGEQIADPNAEAPTRDQPVDAVAALFGTINQSSRILVRDGHAAPGWVAARLQLHAEDEFSAGSYDSAKRTEARLLQATFSTRILVEGESEEAIAPALRELDELFILGAFGHLPVGGKKTQGAGWGRWVTEGDWRCADVQASTEASAPRRDNPRQDERKNLDTTLKLPSSEVALRGAPQTSFIRVVQQQLHDQLGAASLTLAEAATLARKELGALACWWCEPRIVLGTNAPATFGWDWPTHSSTLVEEVVFFNERQSWRAALTARGWRAVLLDLADRSGDGAIPVLRREVPARLHQQRSRFDADLSTAGSITLVEWSQNGQVVGYTAKRRGESNVRG